MYRTLHCAHVCLLLTNTTLTDQSCVQRYQIFDLQRLRHKRACNEVKHLSRIRMVAVHKQFIREKQLYYKNYKYVATSCRGKKTLFHGISRYYMCRMSGSSRFFSPKDYQLQNTNYPLYINNDTQ